jgi:hypothetical protein
MWENQCVVSHQSNLPHAFIKDSVHSSVPLFDELFQHVHFCLESFNIFWILLQSNLPMQSPVLKGHPFLVRSYIAFHMNWISFKRSHFLCPNDDLLIQVWLYIDDMLKCFNYFHSWMVLSENTHFPDLIYTMEEIIL